MNITLPQIKKIAKNITVDAKNLYAAKNLKHSIVLDIIARSLDSKNFSGLSSQMKKETDYSKLHQLSLKIPSSGTDFFIGVFPSKEEANKFIPTFISNILNYFEQLEKISEDSLDESTLVEDLEKIYGHKIPIEIDFSFINYGHNAVYEIRNFHLINNNLNHLSSEYLAELNLRSIGQDILHFAMKFDEYKDAPDHLFYNKEEVSNLYLKVKSFTKKDLDKLLFYFEEEFAIFEFKMDPILDMKKYAIVLGLLQTFVFEYGLDDSSGLISSEINSLELASDVLLYSQLTELAAEKITNLKNGETLLVILPDESASVYREIILGELSEQIKSPISKFLKNNDSIDTIFAQARASIDKVFLITSREELNKYSDSSKARLFANTKIMDIS